MHGVVRKAVRLLGDAADAGPEEELTRCIDRLQLWEPDLDAWVM